MINKKNELIIELKKIRDDHDFIVGAVSIAGSEPVYEKMLEHIHEAKRSDMNITSDDILAMAFSLREKIDESKSAKRIAVAVL